VGPIRKEEDGDKMGGMGRREGRVGEVRKRRREGRGEGGRRGSFTKVSVYEARKPAGQ